MTMHNVDIASVSEGTKNVYRMTVDLFKNVMHQMLSTPI